MMERSDIVYSREVIEFTAVANEYCALLEEAAKNDGRKLLMILQRLLPMLYTKALALPDTEPAMEETLLKHVQEADWQAINSTLLSLLGETDMYLDISTDDNSTEEIVSASISENLTDIYQDLKDFLLSYRIGTEDLMNEAILECNESFKLFWADKLVDTIRAIHYILKNNEEIGEQGEFGSEDMDTSSWIISKRQEDLRNMDSYE